MTARTVPGKGVKEVVHSLLQRPLGFVKYKSAQMRTQTAIISIQDLTSEAIPSLAQALKAVSGVESVDFSLERSVVVVEFDPKQSNVDNLLRAVLKAGYKVG